MTRLSETLLNKLDAAERDGGMEAVRQFFIDEVVPGLEAAVALSRCLLPVSMSLAQCELVDEPVPDGAVVLHFMGSGASDQVTAGEVRAAIAQFNSALTRIGGEA